MMSKYTFEQLKTFAESLSELLCDAHSDFFEEFGSLQLGDYRLMNAMTVGKFIGAYYLNLFSRGKVNREDIKRELEFIIEQVENGLDRYEKFKAEGGKLEYE